MTFAQLINNDTTPKRGMVVEEAKSLSRAWDMLTAQRIEEFGDEDAYDSFLQCRLWNLSKWLGVDFDELLEACREHHNAPADFREVF